MHEGSEQGCDRHGLRNREKKRAEVTGREEELKIWVHDDRLWPWGWWCIDQAERKAVVGGGGWKGP
jgi:hypothetical protein